MIKPTIALIACLISTTTYATILKPEITCYSDEFSFGQWGAICNNGTTDITITGPATCSDTAPTDGPFSKSAIIDTNEDEDMIYCWCKISAPFTSQYVYAYEYLYQTECENWCPSVCAQSATSNTKFRNSIFSDLK